MIDFRIRIGFSKQYAKKHKPQRTKLDKSGHRKATIPLSKMQIKLNDKQSRKVIIYTSRSRWT